MPQFFKWSMMFVFGRSTVGARGTIGIGIHEFEYNE
jgi:hypothetical protein